MSKKPQQVSEIKNTLCGADRRKDYSEIARQVNRIVRDQEAWEDKLRQYEADRSTFMAEYWYKGNLASGDCSKKQMCFMVFEECSL